MTITEALHALGVRDDTLTPEEKEALDRDGFLLLRDVLSPEQVQALGARIDALREREGDAGGQELGYVVEPGTLADLVNKDPQFEVCYTHPRVLAAVAHVLGGDLKLSSLNSRSALPGQGLQELHADWEEPVPPGQYQVCNSIWLLDDFTEDNGATRLVPGTHRSGLLPRDRMPDPAQPHLQERLLLAPAGTVCVFNAHTWHGGTRNVSAGVRRALHAYYCRRHQPQQQDQKACITPETRARSSAAVQVVLDVSP